MARLLIIGLMILPLLVSAAVGSGCVNKRALGDREGFREVDTVQTIAEARKAVQWVETDLDGYEPDSPEALRARDEVLVQWSRVRDRAAELQVRLDGMSSERWSGRDPQVTTDFYQTSQERAAVLRQETSRLLNMWSSMNERFRTPELGVGSRRSRN